MRKTDNTPWKFDSLAYNRLNDLIQVISPSMNEVSMARYLQKLWYDKSIELESDVLGNLYAVINKEGHIHIGVVAHMDTVAIQITNILHNGLLQFRSIGLNPHVLLGQQMVVLTEKGLVHGSIGFDPTSQYGQPKGLTNDDIWLDIAAISAKEACSMVEVGDLAVLKPSLKKVNNNFILGTGIDNRIGLFILTEYLHMFVRNPIPSICLHIIASTQEEVGLRGASIIAAKHPLDACLIIDVDYATDTLTPHENQMGILHLGKGVGLHVKADNNYTLRKMVCQIASQKRIPIQKSVGRFVYGGTDATSLQLQYKGIATMNVNIPCRYMHSPIEMCHKADVEYAILLLNEIISEIGTMQLNCFIPQ